MRWAGLAAALAIACSAGPRRAPAPRSASRPPPRPDAVAGAVAGAVVGQMCPEAAGGRPAVLPLVIAGTRWTTDPSAVSRAVARGEVRAFAVFAWDGRRAGVFRVAGAADVGLAPRVALGSYAGGSPCAAPARPGDPARDIPECAAALAGCGLAVAPLEPGGGYRARPFDEVEPPPRAAVGGACAAAGQLVVDIDGDGHPEVFRLADVLAGGSFADEWGAAAAPARRCEPRFAIRGIAGGDGERLDLVGVVDVDGDGRREVVLALDRDGGGEWAVYSAAATPARLELVGRAAPFPRHP
ncbi:MAG: hypothetical protein D6689_00365 [Deltaproteobacteria bacterium]|nr:MAG: hypothetical protein D6689_00365 [Deltaproteobacteria bacterium]